MSEGEKEKEEDMRDEEEVSDSEEGDEKKEGAGKWREGLVSPAGRPGIKHLTPVQKSSSEKTSDSSHRCSHHNNKRSFNRKENKNKSLEEKPEWHTSENLSPPQEMRHSYSRQKTVSNSPRDPDQR